MSRYVEFAVFLAFVIGCDVTSGQIISPFAGTITIVPNENITCSSQLMCVEDECNKGRWCERLGDKWVQYAIVTCDSNTAERYCNNGICTRTPMLRCDSSNFICPNVDGVYPDPSNCSRYHICISGFRTTNECPANNVYDHGIGGCKYRRLTSDCVRFICGSLDGQPIVYPKDDRIYGRCFSGKAYISGRCQEYEKYNLVTQKCERYCRSVGTQPDPDRCDKFFLCAETSPARYIPVEMSCGCDQGYDEKKKRCTSDAPCIETSEIIHCASEKNNGSGNGKNNSLSQDNRDQTAEETLSIADDSENSNGNDNVDDRQSQDVQRRSIFSLINRHGVNRNNNNDDSNFGNAPSNPSIKDNSSDDNNAASNDDDVEKDLINADNNVNNDNTENPGIKQRENFLRFLIDWIIRIIGRSETLPN